MKLLWMRFVKVSDVAYGSKLSSVSLTLITSHLGYLYIFSCSFINGLIIFHVLFLSLAG